MTTYNVNELEGALLDAAVAKAEGRLVMDDEPGWNKGDYKNLRQEYRGRHVVRWYTDSGELGGWELLDNQGSPSTDWSYGGSIIERELIATQPSTGGWLAYKGLYDFQQEASSLLVAAMRSFVLSKFGETVDLPD